MTKSEYRLRLNGLNIIMYNHCKGKTGIDYWPYNHLWWLVTLELQRT